MKTLLAALALTCAALAQARPPSIAPRAPAGLHDKDQGGHGRPDAGPGPNDEEEDRY